MSAGWWILIGIAAVVIVVVLFVVITLAVARGMKKIGF